MQVYAMARPREFNPDTALEGATDIFWRQGFKSTSLPDLLEAMGLTRGSLYKAYRDKESVYMLALDHYDKTVVDVVVGRLGACPGPTAWDCLAPLFGPPAPDRRGCFICNAMVELGPDHPEVAEKANAMAGKMRDAIRDVIARHQPERSEADTQATADLVLQLYFGQQAIGKAGGLPGGWSQKLQDMLDG